MSKVYFLLLAMFYFSLYPNEGHSQNHLFSFNTGSSGSDVGVMDYADNKGFVYTVGHFGGSVDFDPSTGSKLLTSNAGSQDACIAKYSDAGTLIWAINFGGTDKDEAAAVSVDNQGNIYVTGFFRGSNVDFDPSPTGTAYVTSNGDNGGDPGYGGDIFVAKYNSNGQYLWAFNMGSSSIGDNGTVIVSDAAGNVYVGGYFSGVTDFDPSAGTSTLSPVNGEVFLAKYNANGQYQWAFNLGAPNNNAHPFGLKIDNSANIYVTGYFIGGSADFDPSPTNSKILTSNGIHDIYLAKYDSSGLYKWAFSLGSTGADVARELDVDKYGNVYIAGDFQNTVDFDPSPSSVSNLSSVGGSDIFIAKYDNNGNYKWAKKFGSTSSDIAWGVTYTTNNVYLTGSFQGTVNFNPGTIPDNLISNGGSDVYLTKFDLNGNYVCAFKVGGTGDDEASRICSDTTGNLFVTGHFSSSNTDFNPGAGVNNLSTNGIADIFLAKYFWPDNPKPAGTLTGSSICPGQQATLTFTATVGTGPFIIEYSDGVTTYTQTNVQSGVPFNLVPNPASTTTYTLISIRDATVCPSTNNANGITAIVNVGSCNTASFTAPDTVCVNAPVTLANTSVGASSYDWSFCTADVNVPPTGFNMGNVGFLNRPVYIDYVLENGNYYGFVTNNNSSNNVLIRLDFGNSLLNNPTPVNLGTIGGIVPVSTEGLQIVKNLGNWYVIIVGGDPNTGSASAIVKISLGANIANNTATGTYWGNIGNLDYPHDLYIFEDNGSWYGFTVNSGNNTITRFNFSNSFSNIPIGNNLGNIGSLAYPTGVCAIKNNNNDWNIFITNNQSSSLTRLDFGSSLLNTPTGINLGNINGLFSGAWDIQLMNYCSNTYGFLINANNNRLTKLDFNGNFINIPTAINLGNIGNMNFPHCLSKIFRAGSDLYAFTTNVNNNTITRFRFNGCTNASLPSSTLQNPPPVSYNAPGVYNITLVTNEGLSTQASYCKQVVVLPAPAIATIQDTSICRGSTVVLNTTITGSTGTPSWTPLNGTLSNPHIANPTASPNDTTKYIVAATNGYCAAKDSVTINVKPPPAVTLNNDTSFCKGVSYPLTATGGGTYQWTPVIGYPLPAFTISSHA